jgi:hypothetical protein
VFDAPLDQLLPAEKSHVGSADHSLVEVVREGRTIIDNG